ncbi:hypothetical protein [Neobittarella massiliensis]|uniref:hypothetical protein n=1 Tax=Neobittarella massiliensis (ex Bilen et al. 2018) TaxID=2041842 RepID=UPI000CF6C623|nr:hypothetical protein [Neobittarella massiliensis]
MAECKRTPWSDAQLEQRLRECVAEMQLERMPSCRELNAHTGSGGFSARLVAAGGMYSWARRLGLPLKQSATEIGRQGEEYAALWLQARGYTVERMSARHPYDLLIDRAVKADVKFAHLGGRRQTGRYSFELRKIYPTCDIYLLVTEAEEGCRAVYVLPAQNAMHRMLSMGSITSKYQKYRGRTDIIDRLLRAFAEVG